MFKKEASSARWTPCPSGEGMLNMALLYKSATQR